MKNHNGGTHQATLTTIGGIRDINIQTMMSQQTLKIQSQIWVHSVWHLDWMHLALWIWKMLRMRECLMNFQLEKIYFQTCFDILIDKSDVYVTDCTCFTFADIVYVHWNGILIATRVHLRYIYFIITYLFWGFTLFHPHPSCSAWLFPMVHTAQTTPCFIYDQYVHSAVSSQWLVELLLLVHVLNINTHTQKRKKKRNQNSRSQYSVLVTLLMSRVEVRSDYSSLSLSFLCNTVIGR